MYQCQQLAGLQVPAGLILELLSNNSATNLKIHQIHCCWLVLLPLAWLGELPQSRSEFG
jgi:hypothetical protein